MRLQSVLHRFVACCNGDDHSMCYYKNSYSGEMSMFYTQFFFCNLLAEWVILADSYIAHRGNVTHDPWYPHLVNFVHENEELGHVFAFDDNGMRYADGITDSIMANIRDFVSSNLKYSIHAD